ncbi:MAG: Crp/Fnr family transcriptional regulator [bacterium]
MPIEKLIAYFDNLVPLTDEEKEKLSKRVSERRIKRRQFLLQEGDICKHYNFIIEGCCKMYGVDEKGGEHNIQFAAENDWITDIGSFHSGSPSKLYIEAIEPSIVLQIAKPDLLFFYEDNITFNRNFRVLIENKFVELQNRVLQNISSTAEERYLAFIAQYPQLYNRLPSTQIASYLGITPEFLSKIRKEITSK